MPTPASTIRILVVRTWTAVLALRGALRTFGDRVHLTVVDIEPALNAALARTTFDLVLYDPSTPAITRDTLAARLREHRRDIPVIEITTLESLECRISEALALRMN
jgi:CheY-like chemotaxis protein